MFPAVSPHPIFHAENTFFLWSNPAFLKSTQTHCSPSTWGGPPGTFASGPCWWGQWPVWALPASGASSSSWKALGIGIGSEFCSLWELNRLPWNIQWWKVVIVHSYGLDPGDFCWVSQAQWEMHHFGNPFMGNSLWEFNRQFAMDNGWVRWSIRMTRWKSGHCP